MKNILISLGLLSFIFGGLAFAQIVSQSQVMTDGKGKYWQTICVNQPINPAQLNQQIVGTNQQLQMFENEQTGIANAQVVNASN